MNDIQVIAQSNIGHYSDGTFISIAKEAGTEDYYFASLKKRKDPRFELFLAFGGLVMGYINVLSLQEEIKFMYGELEAVLNQKKNWRADQRFRTGFRQLQTRAFAIKTDIVQPELLKFWIEKILDMISYVEEYNLFETSEFKEFELKKYYKNQKSKLQKTLKQFKNF